jgi:CRISPR-associated protein Csx10
LSEGSSVFRYDALAAGQRYRAIVTLSAPEHAPVLDKLHALYQGLLSEGGRAFIGKSRGAGYGEVQLSQPAGAEITDHDEYHPSQQAGPLTVTLLSDALVRGSNGAMATDIAHLVSARPLRAFTRTRIVGGFNRTWGLPMPQELALQAGSVFVFEAKDEAAKALGRVAAAGIGERCVEGFGRIAVNWHAQAKLRRVSYTTPPPVARPLQQGSPGYQLAQTMAQRMLRAKLDATLIEVLNRLEIVQPPAQSQLARMRTFVREGWRTENLGLVTEQLIKLKSSRRQFEEAHVRGISLFKWMRDLANQPARVWDELRFQEGSRQEMPRVGGVDAKLDDRMAADYAARLMDGLLHKTAKAKRQQRTGGRS